MRNPGLCAIVGAIVLSGCGLTAVQKDQVSTFGSATAAVGSAVSGQLPLLRDDMIRMNTAELTFKDQKDLRNLAGFRMEGGLSTAHIAAMITAVDALQKYGAVLNQLATADESAGIKASATALASDVGAVKGVSLSQSDKNDAVQAVDAIGGLFVDYQRKQALGKIVKAYAGPVDTIAALLGNDLSLDPHADGVLQDYDMQADQLQNLAIGVITRHPAVPFEERQAAVRSLAMAKQNLEKARQISTTATDALSKLRAANGKLAEVLENDQGSSAEIASYAQSIQKLGSTLKALVSH